MKNSERAGRNEGAEALLRSFYAREIRNDARRRDGDRQAGLLTGAPFPAPHPAGRRTANAELKPFRALFAAAACLAAMSAATLAGRGEGLGSEGICIAARELGSIAEERGLFIPFRALWPAEDYKGEL